MIESALVFALGALTTAILAIVVMPAFTRRAARLARRDLEQRLPRTLDEIAALRDGVRAEYAARTARVQATLEAANQSLVAERLTKADMAVQLSALRSERRAYQATMSEAEERITGAFADLREREESLARAAMEKRELERQLIRVSEKLAEAETRAVEAERWAGGVFPSPLPADSPTAETPAAPIGRAQAPVFPDLAAPPPPFVPAKPFGPLPTAEERLARFVNGPLRKTAPITVEQVVVGSPSGLTEPPADEPTVTEDAELAQSVQPVEDPAAVAAAPAMFESAPVKPVAGPVEPFEAIVEPVETDGTPVELAAGPAELKPEPVVPEAEPEEEKEPEPVRTVASLPPKMAAAIAEQLKAARARPLGQPVPTGPEPAMALPPVAPWSVSLTPPEIPPVEEKPVEQRPAPRSARGRQAVSRPSRSKDKAPEPAPARDPHPEPPIWSATTGPKVKAAPRARAARPSFEETPPPAAKRPERKSRSWNLDADGVPIGSTDAPASVRIPLGEASAADAFAPRPVPVVRRPASEEAVAAAPIDQAPAPASGGDAAFDPIANLPPRAIEAFDPIANLPPRGSDTISFAPIATPIESPELELADEERSRRVDSLAERLRALRRRGAGEAPPAKSG